jgi:hypothetical protein
MFEDTKGVIRSRKLTDRQHNVGKKKKRQKDKQRSRKLKLNFLFIILIGWITTSDICNINRVWLLCLGSLIFLLWKTLNYLNFNFECIWWIEVYNTLYTYVFCYLPPLDKRLYCCKNIHFSWHCLVTMDCIRTPIKINNMN